MDREPINDDITEADENSVKQREYILKYIDYLKRLYGIRIKNEQNLNIWKKKYKKYYNNKINYLDKNFELSSDNVKNKLTLNLIDKLKVVYDPNKPAKNNKKCKVQYCDQNKMKNFNVCEYHKCKVPSCPFVKHCREFEYDNKVYINNKLVYKELKSTGVEETKEVEIDRETKEPEPDEKTKEEEEPVLKQNIKDIFNVQGVKFNASNLINTLLQKTFITNLNISNQYISDLNIGKNETIKILNISNNYFNSKSFNEVIQNFTALERLNASNNLIEEVKIENLEKIVDLNLSYNKIKTFEIINIKESWLEYLKKLYSIYVLEESDNQQKPYLYINFNLQHNLIEKVFLQKQLFVDDQNYLYTFDYSYNLIQKFEDKDVKDFLFDKKAKKNIAYKFYGNNFINKKDNDLWIERLELIYLNYEEESIPQKAPDSSTVTNLLYNLFNAKFADILTNAVKGTYDIIKSVFEKDPQPIYRDENLKKFINFIRNHNLSNSSKKETKENFMVNYNEKFKINTNESSIKFNKNEEEEPQFPYCIRHVKLAYKDELLNELYFNGNNLKFTTHRDIFINDMEDLYKSNILLAYFTQLQYIEEDTLKLTQLKLKPWFLENKDVINKYVLSFIQ